MTKLKTWISPGLIKMIIRIIILICLLSGCSMLNEPVCKRPNVQSNIRGYSRKTLLDWLGNPYLSSMNYTQLGEPTEIWFYDWGTHGKMVVIFIDGKVANSYYVEK